MSLLSKFEQNKMQQINLSSKLDDFATDLNKRLQVLESKMSTVEHNTVDLVNVRLVTVDKNRLDLINELEQVHNLISNNIGDCQARVSQLEKKLDEKQGKPNNVNQIVIKPLLK